MTIEITKTETQEVNIELPAFFREDAWTGIMVTDKKQVVRATYMPETKHACVIVYNADARDFGRILKMGRADELTFHFQLEQALKSIQESIYQNV